MGRGFGGVRFSGGVPVYGGSFGDRGAVQSFDQRIATGSQGPFPGFDSNGSLPPPAQTGNQPPPIMPGDPLYFGSGGPMKQPTSGGTRAGGMPTFTSPLGSQYTLGAAGQWLNSQGFPRATAVNPNDDPYGLSGGDSNLGPSATPADNWGGSIASYLSLLKNATRL